MSEATQEGYRHDSQITTDSQQQHLSSLTQVPAQSAHCITSPRRTYKRKRDSLEASRGTEEIRSGTEENAISQTHPFKQSPNMSAAFMPINPNSPQNSQYTYQPLNVAQHPPNTINGSSAADTANATLAVNAMSSLLPSLGVQPGGMTFDSGRPGEQHLQMDGRGTFVTMLSQTVENHPEVMSGGTMNHTVVCQPVQQPVPVSNPKPQVGTEEWHRIRRDNHKEVERRRRETINEGINELAKIVPGCEKNKGSILQRAVQYIQQLKANEAQNIDKWTIERVSTERAIQELSQNVERLQKDLERAWREAETWKKNCLQAGVARESNGPSQGQPNMQEDVNARNIS